MIRSLHAVLVSGLVAGCSVAGGPSAHLEQEITNGVDDGDTAVVALLAGGSIVCSGVLVAPRVVLTAAHCLTPTPDAVSVGPRPAGGATAIGLQQQIIHPEFDPQTLAQDLAMLTLVDDANGAPAALAGHPLDGSIVGRPVVVAGFGRSATGDQSAAVERSGTAVVKALGDAELQLEPGPAQPCLGDSGGPTLLRDGDGESVIGIHSSGDLFCSGFARDIRVDAERAFIDPFVFGEPYRTGNEVRGGCSAVPVGDPPALTLFALLTALIWRGARRVSIARRTNYQGPT